MVPTRVARVPRSAAGESTYRVSWAGPSSLVDRIFAGGGLVLDATGQDDWWRFRLLFADREKLSRGADFCEDRLSRAEVRTVYALDGGNADRFGLTDQQRRTLLIAYCEWYYEFPHAVTTADLGARFDISAQTAPNRLRRGHRNLVANALVAGPDGGE